MLESIRWLPWCCNEWMNIQWINEWKNGWMKERTKEQQMSPNEQTHELRNKKINEWSNEKISEQTEYEQMNEQVSEWILLKQGCINV